MTDLTASQTAQLMLLAKNAAWQIKEQTMRRQFETLVEHVKDGSPSTTLFTPMDGDHLHVFNAIVAALSLMEPGETSLAVASARNEAHGAASSKACTTGADKKRK